MHTAVRFRVASRVKAGVVTGARRGMDVDAGPSRGEQWKR